MPKDTLKTQLRKPPIIQCLRAWDKPSADDGYRVLVDRLWPRGIKRETLKLDDWWRSFSPSDDLRRWFNHDISRWLEFQQRYHLELSSNEATLKELLQSIHQQRLTLIYAASDREHNNAVALTHFIQGL